MNETKNSALYLYSPTLITVATVIGAPVAGCILLAHNYRSLGKLSTVRKLLYGGILRTIALFVIAFLLLENFPRMSLPIGYIIGMRHAVKQFHSKDYVAHIANGGTEGPAWKTILIGIGGLCAAIIVAFLVILMLAE